MNTSHLIFDLKDSGVDLTSLEDFCWENKVGLSSWGKFVLNQPTFRLNISLIYRVSKSTVEH